jgi:hypothetical protein
MGAPPSCHLKLGKTSGSYELVNKPVESRGLPVGGAGSGCFTMLAHLVRHVAVSVHPLVCWGFRKVSASPPRARAGVL